MRRHPHRVVQLAVAVLCWFTVPAHGALRGGVAAVQTKKRTVAKHTAQPVPSAQWHRLAAMQPLSSQYQGAQRRRIPASLLQESEHRVRGFVGGALGQVAGGAMGAMGLGYASGRGRGRGRAKMYYGPDEFDDSWWTPPPPIGPDPFMQGYSSHVYPRQQFGYGAMPHGGFGTAHHFWGGSSYQPGAHASWRGRSFSAPRSGGSPYMPYQTPRDSYGMGLYQPGMGANLPVSSPYYYTPPPLQGDWNLPKNPPPPPAAAAGR